jgi:hypothetical protein
MRTKSALILVCAGVILLLNINVANACTNTYVGISTVTVQATIQCGNTPTTDCSVHSASVSVPSGMCEIDGHFTTQAGGSTYFNAFSGSGPATGSFSAPNVGTYASTLTEHNSCDPGNLASVTALLSGGCAMAPGRTTSNQNTQGAYPNNFLFAMFAAMALALGVKRSSERREMRR